MAAASDARALFSLVRKGIDVRNVDAHVRKPFRFVLAGDPLLVANLRALLLSGYDGPVPRDVAACVETLQYGNPVLADRRELRAAIFVGRRGDASSADMTWLTSLGVPVLALTIDADAAPAGPPSPPQRGTWSEYVEPAITAAALRGRFFVHLVSCSHNVEIAVGRNLPVLRETVAAKLTRDAAMNALKVSLASAVVDHIPVVGFVLGAVASAGDMVAITGIQVLLMLHIEAVYGRDPDIARAWQLLPIIGGGLGWRTLARELVGFVPIAGIAIKGAIAYAGTIVVGEGVTFFQQNGEHMTKGQAAKLYDRAKGDAMRLARDVIARFRR